MALADNNTSDFTKINSTNGYEVGETEIINSSGVFTGTVTGSVSGTSSGLHSGTIKLSGTYNETTAVNSTTIAAADTGKVFYWQTDTAAIFTLPATALGLSYTFVNAGANGNNAVTISPNSSDAIYGTIPVRGSDETASTLTGTVNVDLVNTKSTARRGDYVTLVGDGDDGWYALSGVGIWAMAS